MSNRDRSTFPSLISNSTPLYLQLAQTLKEAIDNGLYSSGSKLPTENELSKTYHVSRVTVRKALLQLEELGYIERKVGSGTYVAEKKLQRNFFGSTSSFTLMCKETGMNPSAKMIRMEVSQPDQKQKKKMNLPGGAQVLLIERIRYADTQPVMIERDYFSDEFRFLFAEDLEKNSLYEVIRQKKDITFPHADRTIDIVFATASEAKMLGIKTGFPLLRICSISQSDVGEHITISEQLCIGDKFKLHMMI